MTMLANPGSIGKMELKNHMLMAPMGPHFGDINRTMVEYFARRAEGGAAMLIINMMPTGYFEDTSATVVLTEENYANFKEIVDRAHAVGCKVCPQIMPGCGRIAPPGKIYPEPMSASACGWLMDPNVKCHEMTQKDIDLVLKETRRLVELAVKAGADAFELHAYGGYLNDQFLTAAWNTRTDKYGGDFRGRATFLLEQAAIVKEIAGEDCPVIVKFCPDHGVPYPGWRQLDEGIALAKYLEEQGIDALHVDAGCYEKWQLAMPPLFYQEAVMQLRSAKAIKEHVSIPVLTHGRLSNVSKAEAALRNGLCDFAVIGRGLLADPDLPNKVMQGRPEDIRPCISCNEGCIGNIMKGQHLACALNPFTGYEDTRKLEKASEKKKVLVVGGGPGGCAAAILAKEAGHEVELWERKAVIGGKTLAASAPYMKTDMMRLPQYYALKLQREGIPVRLFKEATRESIAAYEPDVLIWAAGDTDLRPGSIPGIDGSNVYFCEEALRNEVPLGKRVVIVGGGPVGIEAAVHFDKLGHEVTVVEMLDKMMAEPEFIMNDTMLRDMMANGNGVYLTSTKLVEIRPDGIVAEGPEGRREIPCDTVLLAMGGRPNVEFAHQMEDICKVFTIGDSNRRGKILNAVEEAYLAVQKI